MIAWVAWRFQGYLGLNMVESDSGASFSLGLRSDGRYSIPDSLLPHDEGSMNSHSRCYNKRMSAEVLQCISPPILVTPRQPHNLRPSSAFLESQPFHQSIARRYSNFYLMTPFSSTVPTFEQILSYNTYEKPPQVLQPAHTLLHEEAGNRRHSQGYPGQDPQHHTIRIHSPIQNDIKEFGTVISIGDGIARVFGLTKVQAG